MAEGVQLVSIGSQPFQPKLEHSCLGQLLVLEFGWHVGEPGDGVGKLVLQEKLPESPEPRLGGQRCSGEDRSRMVSQNVVAITQSTKLPE